MNINGRSGIPSSVFYFFSWRWTYGESNPANLNYQVEVGNRTGPTARSSVANAH
jgi:hypothetical protein